MNAMRRLPTCQYCVCGPDMIDGLVIDQATKRCSLCESEWIAVTAGMTSPRAIGRAWRNGAPDRLAARKRAMRGDALREAA